MSAIVSFLLFLTGPHEPRAADPMTAAITSPLHQWIESLRAPVDADSYWASIHANMPWSAPLEQHVLERLRRRFCVGCEMPPWLVHLLDKLAIPYVDIRLHPVRFMDDLMFVLGRLRLKPRRPSCRWRSCGSIRPEIVDAGLRWHDGATPDFWRRVLAPHAPVTACGCRRSRTDCGSRSTVFGTISRSIRPHSPRIHAANVRLDVGAPCGDRAIRSAAPPHAGAGR